MIKRSSLNHQFEAQLSTAGDPFADEVYNLWVQMHRVTDLIVRARERELSTWGIPIRQVATLFAVNAFSTNATMTRLADFLGRRAHTISSILSRMEKDGLIIKRNDPKRRNVVRVALTEKGREAYHRTTHRESINRIMGSLSETERNQFKAMMDRLEKEANYEISRLSRQLATDR